MEERKFKVGDKLTYKFKKDLTHNYYHFGGGCQGGFVGKIREYQGYIQEKKCWQIIVETRSGIDYSMIESEFLEYDLLENDSPVVKDMFPIF